MSPHRHQVIHWQHRHDFSSHNHKGENRAKWVFLLTVLTTLIEIVAGLEFHSMALLADGWHMSTHAVAFMITIYAYRYARIHQHDRTFAFSPAKVGVLGAFASSIALGFVALMMLLQSAERFFQPQSIQFDEALWVAMIGFVVNLLSVILLHDHSDHSHEFEDHDHKHDHNLRAAYLHVIADLMTSVLAIVALAAAKFYGYDWLDPLMGVVGALVILVWAKSLIHNTSPILLDHAAPAEVCLEIADILEGDGETAVTDLHVWQLATGKYALMASVITQSPKSPVVYKNRLTKLPHIKHVTLEVNQCYGEACQISE